MSIKGYKILLAALVLVWAGLSFALFGQKLQTQATLEKAHESISVTENFFDQYSKQIKFKLGQWVYNYQLKNTKGVEFDDKSFMDSEFDMVAFYSFNADRPYAKEWAKSKDFTAADLPESILEKIQKTNFSAAQEKPYMWFSGLDAQGQPYVVVAFAIDEPVLGAGLVVGVMDMEYLPYNSLSSHTVVLDNDNRFLLHPQKEYLAQKTSMNLSRMAPGELFIKDAEYWLVGPSSKKTGSHFLYNEEKQSLISFIGFPLLILLAGLILLSGFQVFLHEDVVVDKEEEALAAKDPISVSQSDIDFAGYESVLKVQSLREKLNKMTLLSSSLKGRLDLAVMGDYDQQLLDDLQSDFTTLDGSIDEAFREASELGYEEQDIVEQITKAPAVVTKAPALPKAEVSKPDKDAVEEAQVKESLTSDSKNAVQAPEKLATDSFAFEIMESDIDLEFADSLSLHKTEGVDVSEEVTEEDSFEFSSESIEDEELTEEFTTTKSTVIKEPTPMYGSALVSESLEEAKSALASLGLSDEQEESSENLVEFNDIEDADLSPLPGSVEFKGNKESKNDWAKVIEELTEELNNLDLDFVETESESSATVVAKKNKGEDKITPPRVEL